MNKMTLVRCAGIVFAIVAVGNLVRLVVGWEVSVAGRAVPLWASGLAVLVAGYLSYESFRKRPGRYGCTGSCGGVSSTPGVCQAASCEKKGLPLTEE